MSLYTQLFGKRAPVDSGVTDFAEHGRVGGVSTGQPFKFVTPIDGATTQDLNQWDNMKIMSNNSDWIII